MSDLRVLDAFQLECAALSRAVAGVSAEEWDLPTRCLPWSVGELLAHVRVVIAWLPDMLAAAPPVGGARVSAAGYYRADDRFAPQVNAARIELARDFVAARGGGAAVGEDFAATWQRVDGLCRAERADRLVVTRHSDVMWLSEFLVTRVVEVAAHGLDLADALGREPWLSAEAGDVVAELLFGADWAASERALGWERPDLLRRATGRRGLVAAEIARVERVGIRWLTLG